jgi:dipeptidyl aminopeptidase/acylaminoacyl peptidase
VIGEVAADGAASPLDRVGSGDAPFLVLHGTEDALVPPLNPQAFTAASRTAGVPAELVMVQHTGHSMATPGQQPSTQTVRSMMVDFFATTLDPHPGGSRLGRGA